MAAPHSGTPQTTPSPNASVSILSALKGRFKGEPSFDPMAYGAAADGVTDDTAAIQLALDAAAAAGGIVNGSSKRYKVSSTLDLSSNVQIRDMTLDATELDAEDIILAGEGTADAAVLLTADATEGDTSLTVADVGDLAEGDWLRLTSSALFGDTSQERGEIVRISDAAGTTITLFDPLADSYATADGAQIEKVTFLEGVKLERLNIIGPTDDTLLITGVEMDLVRDIAILDCTFTRTHYNGIALRDAIGTRVVGCHFDKIEKTGLAYGVAVLWASQDVTISACTGIRLRHLVTIGGGAGRAGIARRIAVTGCTASQAMEAGFDCHPGGEDITFVGNHVYGSDQDGIVFQGSRGIIANNTVRGVGRHGILLSPLTMRPHEMIVDGNQVRDCVQRGIMLVKDADWDDFDAISITNNQVSDCLLGGIEVGSSGVTLTNLTISGNVVVGNGSHGIVVNTVDYGTISHNFVEITAASVNGIRLITVTRLTVVGNTIRSLNNSSSRCILTSNADDCVFVGNNGTGAGVGILLDSGSINNVLTANQMRGNTVGYSLSTGTNNLVGNNLTGVLASVASAATLALPASENSVYLVTGTTGITSITALDPGRIVVLKFAGILTVTDGSNLKLNGNFVTSADDTLALFCDGTNWFEIARSGN